MLSLPLKAEFGECARKQRLGGNSHQRINADGILLSESKGNSFKRIINGAYEIHKQSANGARYESQGQARSASPLVSDNQSWTSPEGAQYEGYRFAI